MTTTTVKLEVRGAVKELFRSNDPCVCISGPAGTGKTFPTLFWIHLVMLRYPGTRALILRKTHKSLTASTLTTFNEKVLPEAIESGLVRWYGGSGSEPAGYRYSNGSRIVVGGLDNPDKILSTEYSVILVDEATEITRRDVDTLKTRLRGASATAYPYYRLVMLTNPGPPTHHLKTAEDVRMLHSVHEDNPSLFSNGEWTLEGLRYLESLETLTGVQYERLRWGRWVSSDGIVYPEFQESVHVIPRYEIPEDWDRYLVVDYGFVHPFVAQWWAIDPDGRAVMYRELYKTKTLVEDHAREIKRLSEGEPRFKAVITDHHAENRASLERHLGVVSVAAHKTVMDGIDAVATRLRDAGDGSPRIFFMEDSLSERDSSIENGPHKTVDEFSCYSWDSSKEKPVKEHDDGLDCVRYLVAHLDLKKQRGITSVGGFNF